MNGDRLKSSITIVERHKLLNHGKILVKEECSDAYFNKGK
jgi:hypothetical protein